MFYAEHAAHLFPAVGEGSSMEARLMRALKPSKSEPPSLNTLLTYTSAIYWLVIFSIFIHGLSIPLLSILYKLFNVPPEVDPLGPAEVRPLSYNQTLPPNSFLHSKRRSILLYNRFSRTKFPSNLGWNLPHFRSNNSSRTTDHNPLVEEFQLQPVNEIHRPETSNVV